MIINRGVVCLAHIHLPDGVMPLWWCAVWFVAAALLVGVVVAVAGRRLELRERVMAAFFTVVFSVAMLIPVPSPFGGTHMNMTPLAGVVAGPAASALAVFVVSLVMALLGHGGVTVLGANVLILYFECVAAYLSYRALRRRFSVYASASAAAFASLFLSTFLASGMLAVSVAGSPSYHLGEFVAESILVHGLLPEQLVEQLAWNPLVHELIHGYLSGNIWLHDAVQRLSSNPLLPCFWLLTPPHPEELMYAAWRVAELSSPLRFFAVFTATTLPVNLLVAVVEAAVTGVVVQSTVRSRPDVVVAEQGARRVEPVAH
ncbi:MAG: energy-coupling factor ABC transporter permease [Candidatus Freyarchaeota archaeon]|nr:energy-coupling factor ABC transporter permease [Candidatus Jordarchaeia archaeon]